MTARHFKLLGLVSQLIITETGTTTQKTKQIFFKLKDNCFTEFCCFLSNLNMNQPSVQFSSVAQLCPTLCDPMNHSTPGLPVHHHLLEFTQTMYTESVMPSSHLILCRPLLLLPLILPASECFPMSQLFTRGGPSTGVSALASVLPVTRLSSVSSVQSLSRV